MISASLGKRMPRNDGSTRGACQPGPIRCKTAQKTAWVHEKWSVVTHYFSLFSLSTMDTCTVTGPFLSIICCALESHQLTPVMSWAQQKKKKAIARVTQICVPMTVN